MNHGYWITLIDFIFAGQGSTAAAITSVIYDLGLHPSWQSRIRSSTSVLQAFLRESWRLSPPFLGTFERVITPGADTTIPGSQVPLPIGTRVGSNAFIVMRSKEAFGDDAEDFKPQRWLVDDEEHKRLDASWGVFGRGSRACIGKDIAMMLVTKVIAEV